MKNIQKNIKTNTTTEINKRRQVKNENKTHIINHIDYLDYISINSFCTGMGSVLTALKELGCNLDVKASIELEKHPRNTVAHNFKVKKQFIDLFYASASHLDYADIFSGGFPCQNFSLAGKLKGFDDRRGTVIFHLFQIILDLIKSNKAPKIIFLENVAHLARHDLKKGEYETEFGNNFTKRIGHTMKVIEEEVLKPLSKYYNISWGIENSKNHNVPHNRNRLFFVMIRKDLPYDFNFSQVREKRNELTTCLKDYLEPNHKVDLKYFSKKEFLPESYRNSGEILRVGSLLGVSYLQSRRVISPKGISATLTTGEDAKYLTGKNKVRTLTVKEKLRIQTYPKWYQFPKDIPDTAKHKMLGNTMTVNVVKNIFTAIFESRKVSANNTNFEKTTITTAKKGA
ncbi:MAG: DNA (cytosine-5-)-methyltransferase [Campylobacterota bacterium]|nr:DNA (cytosine-5-)-methyltransferase [Campylobacterota bacterium]